MNILIVVLGQLPEAIFFALFIILAKNIKKKRLLFTGLMCLEYVLIMMLFQYNWLFHIIYTIMTFLTLKVLYKENAQIQAQQNEINALRLAASQEKQNNYLVNELKPCPIPAYITCNPYQSYGFTYANNSCGCNNGCGC